MIHKFKQLGYNIVLDVNSGAVHLPDDCAYDMLDFVDAPMTEEMPADLPAKLPKYSENEVRESYAELYQLYKEARSSPRTTTKSTATQWSSPR